MKPIRSLTVTVVFVLASIVFLQGPAFAQGLDRFDRLSIAVMPGDLVTVVRVNGVRIQGRVVELTANSITVSTGSQRQQQTFPAIDVVRIVRTDPVRNGIMRGAIIGGIAGMALGLLQNAICSNETGECPGAIVFGAVVGAAGGGAAGLAIDSATGNRVAFDNSIAAIEAAQKPSRPIVPKEHGAELFGSFGAGRTVDVLTPHANAAAGVGFRYSSGVSFEFEFGHTLNSTLHEESCVNPQVQCLCIGCMGRSGIAGLESLRSVTAQVRYTYAARKVQPFVSTGYSIISTKSRVVFPVEHTRTSHSSALPIGVGVRLPVTRSIALRPELTYFVGDVGLFRAVMGIVYNRR